MAYGDFLKRPFHSYLGFFDKLIWGFLKIFSWNSEYNSIKIEKDYYILAKADLNNNNSMKTFAVLHTL